MILSPLNIPNSGVPSIAGPCSAESHEQLLDTASQLSNAGVAVFRAGIWKPRTKPGGFEGHGAIALPWLVDAARRYGMRPATEVATREHTLLALDAGIDFIWIGARTTTNPFAVQEIADTLQQSGRADEITVLVKNPVTPDLELWDGALHRLNNAGVKHLGAIHRGVTPYIAEIYRNSPCWNLPTLLRLRYPELPVFCDPSHMAGRADLVEQLSQTALDLGFYGLMVEVHCNPASALSDAGQQLTPQAFESMLMRLVRRTHIPQADSDTRLDELRRQIDAADSELLDVLSRRMSIAREIGQYKRTHKISAVQPKRYNEILLDRTMRASDLCLDESFIEKLMLIIHDESIRQQL